jgi:hypothetical protein
MGTWGIGVWQDDVAADVVVMFADLLQEGYTAAQAVQHVLDDPPWGWEDEEDAAVQLLAVTAIALQHGVLEAALRDRAVAAIDSQVSLWCWEDTYPGDFADARHCHTRGIGDYYGS